MVKCHDCGLLATRNSETGQWEEVDQNQRDTGQGQLRGVWHKPAEAFFLQSGSPICILRVWDLASEYEQESSKLNLAIVSVLMKERECQSFRNWELGSTPKEHREMMDRERFQKWQAEREEADKKWREQQESKHSKEEWHRYMFIGVFGIVAVVVGVILGHFWE